MLIELIDKYYQDKRNDRAQEHFYVTDAGKCPRAVYFSMKGYPKKEKEARILRIFDRGDLIHQRLMANFWGIPEIRVVASEIDIPSKELFHGRADAIISVDGKLYVVDIKSSSDFKFQKLEEPELPHQYQVQLYMHYFKIPQGILLYENKNTQALKEFELTYDPVLCKKIISDFENLKYQIDNDIVPPIPSELKEKREAAEKGEGGFPWECEYCDFKEVCDKIEKNDATLKI
ncbi:MAG TPA: PD-(D/E)XK nuclease family protein [Candidatus Pacearchaeota archaeon]|nr:PD-(D/E)XK nuclease family protein [Candidatus Pacearchaeota archaeon]HOK94028.1 PD-(D/E)XK nuclease family protein [Candidatus Pacearchaeota archaeon]HPO75099.1 PD-(D/E)XK nuclease family protein [Candidatus Pacearchaeota archaeon]